MTKIEIRFGITSPVLTKQLVEQGFKYNQEQIGVFEKEIEAINRLRFGSQLLTESATHKIWEKLHNKIVKHIMEENGLIGCKRIRIE